MHDELSQPMQVELFASYLRSSATDLKAFMEALATKLSGSLPDQTQVVRHSSLFSREHPVREITITLGDYQYRITRKYTNGLKKATQWQDSDAPELVVVVQ